MKKIAHEFAAIGTCLMLTVLPAVGRCATAQPLSTAPSDIKAASLADRALAFGRMRWIQNGEERKDYKGGAGWNIVPQFLRVEDGGRDGLEINADGSFAWLLARGTYVVYQFRWTDADGSHEFEPKVGFQLTAGARAQCLGTVIVTVETKRNLIGRVTVEKSAIVVEDDCAAIAQDFGRRYTDPDIRIVNSLMWHAPQMPDGAGDADGKRPPPNLWFPVPVRRGK